MSEFVLSNTAMVKQPLILEENVSRGPALFVKKSCHIPLIQQRKGRVPVRELTDISAELLIGADVLGQPIGTHSGGRCSVVISCRYTVVAGSHPHASNGIVVELLANGRGWKVIHSGRVPGRSMNIGASKVLTWTDQDRIVGNPLDLNVFEFVHASHLRVTMNADAYYK